MNEKNKRKTIIMLHTPTKFLFIAITIEFYYLAYNTQLYSNSIEYYSQKSGQTKPPESSSVPGQSLDKNSLLNIASSYYHIITYSEKLLQTRYHCKTWSLPVPSDKCMHNNIIINRTLYSKLSIIYTTPLL